MIFSVGTPQVACENESPLFLIIGYVNYRFEGHRMMGYKAVIEDQSCFSLVFISVCCVNWAKGYLCFGGIGCIMWSEIRDPKY